MKDLHYVLSNFFTHKDFLVEPGLIPGTLFTPLHFAFEAAVLAIILCGAWYVSREKRRILPVFKGLWVSLVVWELVIIWWDSTQGLHPGLDLQNSLSLYPCSIFMYALPFLIWGHGTGRKLAWGYLSTLGLLGALVNFLYPFTRLADYSCLSFPAFHTFYYHGSMLFAWLVVMMSGRGRYQAQRWQDLISPSLFSLAVSIPANLINYSPIDADYMYFKGKFFLLARIFRGVPPETVTGILYVLYILVPALFYLPGFLQYRAQQTEAQYETGNEALFPEPAWPV